MMIDDDPTAAGCTELIERLRSERARGVKSLSRMHSAGGWHTSGRWITEAMERRTGLVVRVCWGSILPPSASYEAHTHGNAKQVAVWCLTGDGELRIEPDVVVPDRPGQVVIFPGDRLHWVPAVARERITVAANLAI